MRDRLIGLVECATREYAEYTAEMFSEGCYGVESLEEFVSDYLLKKGEFVPDLKVGSFVYCRIEGFSQLMKGRVRQIAIFKDGVFSLVVEINGYYAQEYTNKDVGKKVFLSEKEAEKALKGGEG